MPSSKKGESNADDALYCSLIILDQVDPKRYVQLLVDFPYAFPRVLDQESASLEEVDSSLDRTIDIRGDPSAVDRVAFFEEFTGFEAGIHYSSFITQHALGKLSLCLCADDLSRQDVTFAMIFMSYIPGYILEILVIAIGAVYFLRCGLSRLSLCSEPTSTSFPRAADVMVENSLAYSCSYPWNSFT